MDGVIFGVEDMKHCTFSIFLLGDRVKDELRLTCRFFTLASAFAIACAFALGLTTCFDFYEFDFYCFDFDFYCFDSDFDGRTPVDTPTLMGVPGVDLVGLDAKVMGVK